MLKKNVAAPDVQSGTRPEVEVKRPENTSSACGNQARHDSRPICARCFFFKPVSARDALLSGKGECWRYPPRTCPQCLSADEYPVADAAGYCGEFADRDEMISRFDPATRTVMRRRA